MVTDFQGFVATHLFQQVLQMQDIFIGGYKPVKLKSVLWIYLISSFQTLPWNHMGGLSNHNRILAPHLDSFYYIVLGGAWNLHFFLNMVPVAAEVSGPEITLGRITAVNLSPILSGVKSLLFMAAP